MPAKLTSLRGVAVDGPSGIAVDSPLLGGALGGEAGVEAHVVEEGEA